MVQREGLQCIDRLYKCNFRHRCSKSSHLLVEVIPHPATDIALTQSPPLLQPEDLATAYDATI